MSFDGPEFFLYFAITATYYFFYLHKRLENIDSTTGEEPSTHDAFSEKETATKNADTTDNFNSNAEHTEDNDNFFFNKKTAKLEQDLTFLRRFFFLGPKSLENLDLGDKIHYPLFLRIVYKFIFFFFTVVYNPFDPDSFIWLEEVEDDSIGFDSSSSTSNTEDDINIESVSEVDNWED